MPNLFDHYVFDLDDTLADTGFLERERTAAAFDRSKRSALYGRIEKAREFAGAGKLLATLRSRGGRVVILTNSWEEYARRVVAHLGFEADEIVGAAGKPGKGSLARLRDRLDSANGGRRVIHVGDSAAKDLRESVSAGVGFVLCRWGELRGAEYRPRDDERAVLVGQAADVPELRAFLTRSDAD